MAPLTRWRRMLDASKEEAVLAVKLFNDPTGERSLEAFVVHMHLAWLYLLQAEWTKARKDYRVPDPAHKGWFKKIDGEHQTPSLDWFVKEKWSEGSPTRANLEFFIRLRNKIEHRHSGSNDALSTVISGQCHALLLNYEEGIVGVGGQGDSLATVLRFPVFVGGFTDHGKDSIVKLTNSLPADLRTFLAEYDKSLDNAVSRDPGYCLRLSVVLEKGNRKGDLSLQFINMDDLDESAQQSIEDAAAKGVLITQSKQVPVSNLGHMKAGVIQKNVQAAIPYAFNMNHFTAAHQVGKFRPPNGDPTPEKTRHDFVVYDAAHGDYTYTPAYQKYLIKKCSTEEGFKATTGRDALPKKDKVAAK
jgi:hypothetical protein